MRDTLFGIFGLAPFSNKTPATSERLYIAARCKGVLPAYVYYSSVSDEMRRNDYFVLSVHQGTVPYEFYSNGVEVTNAVQRVTSSLDRRHECK